MDIKDVENLANLARLELSDIEKQQILKDMDGILDYVKVVESVDIPEVKPQSNVYNVWREDILTPNDGDFSVELIKKQFPDSQDGFLKVKKIL